MSGILDEEGSPLNPVILLVDDDCDTREMYATFLEFTDVSTTLAADPNEALIRIEERMPDLVVTDLRFSSTMSGADFVHLLKARDDTRDTPVIVLSGWDVNQVPATTRDEADLLLVKPVTPDQLLDRARELIAWSRDLRSNAATLSTLARSRANSPGSQSQRIVRRAKAFDRTPRRRP